MFDTSPEGIQQLLAAGESQTVEFRTKLPPDADVSKLVSAFANCEGGILLVGVADGEIVGLSDHEISDTLSALHKIAESLVPAPHLTDLGCVDVHGRRIAFLIVDKVPSHLAPVATAAGAVYIRQGADIKRLLPSALYSRWSTSLPGIGGSRQVRLEAKATQMEEVTVFVAMSFKEEQEPALADYYRAMERAATHAGVPIKLERIDRTEGDYEISQQIMATIDAADIVLADFTLSPANVYFELGYARGRGKRIIQTARKDTTLEFDVRNWRTVFYRNATQLEELLKPELRAAHQEVTDKRRQQM